MPGNGRRNKVTPSLDVHQRQHPATQQRVRVATKRLASGAVRRESFPGCDQAVAQRIGLREMIGRMMRSCRECRVTGGASAQLKPAGPAAVTVTVAVQDQARCRHHRHPSLRPRRGRPHPRCLHPDRSLSRLPSHSHSGHQWSQMDQGAVQTGLRIQRYATQQGDRTSATPL